jgi:hypothetical protein
MHIQLSRYESITAKIKAKETKRFTKYIAGKLLGVYEFLKVTKYEANN